MDVYVRTLAVASDPLTFPGDELCLVMSGTHLHVLMNNHRRFSELLLPLVMLGGAVAYKSNSLREKVLARWTKGRIRSR